MRLFRAAHAASFRFSTAVVCILLATTFANAADYHHIHMRASDPLAAATWYAENMDGELDTSGPFNAAKFGSTLLLFAPADRAGVDGRAAPGELSSSAGTVVDHLGFSFVNLAEKMTQLEAAGATIVKPAEDVVGLFSYTFIEDPWGQKVEVMQDPEHIGIHHVHLMSADPTATMNWFQTIYGGDIVAFKELPPLPGIRYGDIWLIASQSEGTLRPNQFSMLDHLGWAVANIDATLATVVEHGGRLEREAGPVFWWQRWLPFLAGPQIGFVTSPEGVMVEVLQLE